MLEVLKTGLKRTFSRTGLTLIGAFYLLNVFSNVVNDSLTAQAELSQTGAGLGASSMPLAIQSGPSSLWAGLLALSVVINLWLTIGALRNLVNRRFESLETEFFKENLGMPALNMFVGSIAFLLIVGLGTLLLVIPGIYLLVSLLFWSIFVAVEDDNFIDALKNSWELTKGNKIDLFLIGLGLLGLGVLASLILAVPGMVLMSANQSLGVLISLVGNAFGTVLGLTTLSHAYNELQ